MKFTVAKRPHLRSAGGALWRNAARSNWAWLWHDEDCPYGQFLVTALDAVMATTLRPCTCSRLRRLMALYRFPFKPGTDLKLVERNGAPAITDHVATP